MKEKTYYEIDGLKATLSYDENMISEENAEKITDELKKVLEEQLGFDKFDVGRKK